MNQEPKIEPVHRPILPPELPQKVEVPESVELAKKAFYEALKQNRELNKPITIFELFQIETMKTLVAFAWSFIRNNWHTTVAGVGAVLAGVFAKWGIDVPQRDLDAVMAIGYAVIFKFSSIRWDIGTVIGLVLMIASFFVNPVVGSLGLALDAGTITLIQLGLQQGVAALLKDQEALFKGQDEPALP